MEPADRIEAYFLACSEGTAEDIAQHFTADAVIYDTNIRPARGAEAIGEMWVKVRSRWGGARWTVDSIIADNPPAHSPRAQEVPSPTEPQAAAAHSPRAQEVPSPTEPQAALRAAAIEWSMTGVDTAGQGPFTFRGSEHYRFEDTLISEIRQYWTFNAERLDTGLLDYCYQFNDQDKFDHYNNGKPQADQADRPGEGTHDE